jgi:TonB family protein
MSDTWNRWEGQIVDATFPLLRYLGGTEHSAVFLTERHEGQRLAEAAIKLIPTTSEEGELQLSRWKQAAELSHPHLIPLFAMGRCELDGAPFVYVVIECAEENLAQVLTDRALTPAEAREMLESVLDVLAYLHREGFVHGHIKPRNIMASGDQLKVSIDGLRRAGELLDGPGNPDAYSPPENDSGVLPRSQTLSPAGDVWSLAMTLVETLTQTLPVARTEEQRDPLLPQTLQEPFLDIARHCLLRHPQARWTIAQIAARLEGRAAAPVSRVAPAEPRIPVRQPKPVTEYSRLNAKPRTYLVPISIGCALVLAAILAGPKLLRRHSDAPQVAVATADQAVVPTAPRQEAPRPQQPPAKSAKPIDAKEERGSKTPVPVPTSIHPEPIHEEDAIRTNLPTGNVVHGEIVHRVAPEVLQSARNSIRGAVRVSVKVNVDRSGNVEDAELSSRGPSRYFARAALEAAQLWKFKPPSVAGRSVLSTWILQYEFTRDQTNVIPTQEMP